MKDNPPAVFLMGPTATGKTALAATLVEALPCEIISVDSAMVYRGMDIGTAKPDPELLRRAPHRLIDILDPAEPYSAARFCEDALREMSGISASGRVPLLVGGTMLYFRALQQGLSALPEASPRVRAALEQEAGRVGWAALHRRLQAVDPVAARRIHPNDPQRLQRALEVYEVTGRPLSAWLAAQARNALPYRLLKLALIPPDRERLRARIADRFGGMLEQGLVAEVEALYRRGDLGPGLPSMRAVGYRQVWAYLEGAMDFAAMSERAVTATRQLAKRQMTWLRSETDVVVASPDEPLVAEQIMRVIDAHLS